MKIIEIYRRDETKDAKITRLTRQLRDAQNKNAKAFDQGAAMVVSALRQGASIDEVERKIMWEHVDTAVAQPYYEDTAKVAVPLELDDSEEPTEPIIMLPELP